MSFLLIVFLIFLFIIFTKKKEKEFLFRSMNFTLLLVTLPQRPSKEIQLENYLKTVEQFFSSLAAIEEKNWLLNIFFGNPFLVFEIAVHRIGEEIYFYVASPRSIVELVEKQILGLLIPFQKLPLFLPSYPKKEKEQQFKLLLEKARLILVNLY
jgi:hypothetical protein